MSHALQLHDNEMGSWAVIRQQAEVLVKTGFLPQSVETPEQAMAIILTGRELGIGAMAALSTINVIQGKPTISPQLMLALINRSGQVEDIKIDTGAQGATCTIKRRGRTPYTARFGPAEAAAMGLNGKDNYKKQPATMYKWRAVADAARATFADVLLGLYLPDEMGAAVEPETGEVWQAPPEVGPPVELREEVVEVIEDALTVAAVRQVKLEGAQPTNLKLPTLKGTAGQITALANSLGWNETYLRDELHGHFGLTLGDDLAAALNEIPATDARSLIQAMKGELQSRNR